MTIYIENFETDPFPDRWIQDDTTPKWVHDAVNHLISHEYGMAWPIATWEEPPLLDGGYTIEAEVWTDEWDFPVLHPVLYLGVSGDDHVYLLPIVQGDEGFRIYWDIGGEFGSKTFEIPDYQFEDETWYVWKCFVSPDGIKFKFWISGDPEPEEWHIEDSDIPYIGNKVGIQVGMIGM